MGDKNPIRNLGDYSKPSHEGYQNTIELPVRNNVVSLRSDTIRLVQNGCSFHRLRSEYPNRHLKDFLKLADSLDLDVVNRERTHMRLFQFSLRDLASNWLERLSVGSISTWEVLTNSFSCLILSTGKECKTPNDILMFQQHQAANGKLRDRNTEESRALLEDLILYDNESWNDPRDFAKPVKAISLPQDVPSTSDHRLIELENQVQCLMEAHLAPKQSIQVNKITYSCEICSGPHETQYCLENLKKAFVNHAFSRNNEVGVILNKENEASEEENMRPNTTMGKDHNITIEAKKEVENESEEEFEEKTEEETKEEEEDDPEYFDTFPIVDELRYHKWILMNP
ncbi:hypothetical protein Tco_1014626 [Tanacetum coccineum]